MAKLTITIPDASAPRIFEALAVQSGWTEDVPDTELGGVKKNPVTKRQFAKRVIIDHILGLTYAHESHQAMETARRTAMKKTEKEIVLTEADIDIEEAVV